MDDGNFNDDDRDLLIAVIPAAIAIISVFVFILLRDF